MVIGGLTFILFKIPQEKTGNRTDPKHEQISNPPPQTIESDEKYNGTTTREEAQRIAAETVRQEAQKIAAEIAMQKAIEEAVEEAHLEEERKTITKQPYNSFSIKYFKPIVIDEKGNHTNIIQAGKWIELGMEYEIDESYHSSAKKVIVTEYNTLIAPDGSAMKGAGLKRSIPRYEGKIQTVIPVKIPYKIPEGQYTHYASITINNKKHERTQTIIAKN